MLTPPFQEPMYINGQMSQSWRAYFDEVTKIVNKLNKLSEVDNP